MNVITIMSDEHSCNYMGWAGNGLVKTPNLDRLAAMSVRFTNAYTPCPLCVPARASWFAGRYVNRLGTWDNSTPYDGTVPGISRHLKEQGISTWHFGKTHFHPEGDYGFAELEMPGFLNHPDLGCYYRGQKIGRKGAELRFEQIGIRSGENHDDKVTGLAVEWLRDNRDRREPWNLDIGYLDPHFPFYVKQENWDYYERLIDSIPQGTQEPYTSLNEPLSHLRAYFKGEAASPEVIRRVMIGYCAATAELDERIGILLDTLEELDLMKNTAVIYTSDHGEQLGYHGLWWKCCMFEQSAHIPLLIYHPGVQPRQISAPVSLTDLFPTVCSIFGVSQPEDIDGESLWRLMQCGEDPARKEFAFSEYHAHGVPCAMYMIRWKQYKYVYYTDYEPQLFDLEEDPDEDHDLWGQTEKNEQLRAAAEKCHAFLLSVCSPKQADSRAKEFQQRMKTALGVRDGYPEERGDWVPRPEHI